MIISPILFCNVPNTYRRSLEVLPHDGQVVNPGRNLLQQLVVLVRDHLLGRITTKRLVVGLTQAVVVVSCWKEWARQETILGKYIGTGYTAGQTKNGLLGRRSSFCLLLLQQQRG
jgi:hypothetical protein